jgi:predicted CXXCH cytochrome family protein
VGLDLKNFWRLEEHRAGETTFTHYADGTAHKNRMQGNDFVTSQMYTHGITCFSCHDVHGTDNDADLRKPASVLCLGCHGPNSPNGPRTPTIEAHTHHKAASPGNECVSCHMPKIEQTIADVNVRAHTFRFITPATTDTLKVPNACVGCHAKEPADFISERFEGLAERFSLAHGSIIIAVGKRAYRTVGGGGGGPDCQFPETPHMGPVRRDAICTMLEPTYNPLAHLP